MRHSYNKYKIRFGQDSTQSIVRKLTINFLQRGKLETTVKRAKILKAEVDRLVHKAQSKTEANKNVLLKKLGSSEIVDKLFTQIAPVFSDRTSGFVRIVRTGVRVGDGAECGRVEWVKPVILEEKKETKKEATNEVVSTKDIADKKEVKAKEPQKVKKAKISKK